jgi:hypothetical protein
MYGPSYPLSPVLSLINLSLIHVLCVNVCPRTSHDRFDPSPATNCFFSHELSTLLLAASLSFKKAWAAVRLPLTSRPPTTYTQHKALTESRHHHVSAWKDARSPGHLSDVFPPLLIQCSCGLGGE